MWIIQVQFYRALGLITDQRWFWSPRCMTYIENRAGGLCPFWFCWTSQCLLKPTMVSSLGIFWDGSWRYCLTAIPILPVCPNSESGVGCWPVVSPTGQHVLSHMLLTIYMELLREVLWSLRADADDTQLYLFFPTDSKESILCLSGSYQ